MVVGCVCGEFHDLTSAGMVLVITAFQDGELQGVGTEGVRPRCMMTAFTPENIAAISKKYKGRQVVNAKAPTG
jgi:hypothetical protein